MKKIKKSHTHTDDAPHSCTNPNQLHAKTPTNYSQNEVIQMSMSNNLV